MATSGSRCPLLHRLFSGTGSRPYQTTPLEFSEVGFLVVPDSFPVLFIPPFLRHHKSLTVRV